MEALEFVRKNKRKKKAQAISKEEAKQAMRRQDDERYASRVPTCADEVLSAVKQFSDTQVAAGEVALEQATTLSIPMEKLLHKGKFRRYIWKRKQYDREIVAWCVGWLERDDPTVVYVGLDGRGYIVSCALAMLSNTTKVTVMSRQSLLEMSYSELTDLHELIDRSRKLYRYAYTQETGLEMPF